VRLAAVPGPKSIVWLGPNVRGKPITRKRFDYALKDCRQCCWRTSGQRERQHRVSLLG